MSKTDFLQDLHLLFLSVVLTGLAANDYFVNHTTPLSLPQAEVKMPKVDFESNAIFGMFKQPKKMPSGEIISCPVKDHAHNNQQSLKC